MKALPGALLVCLAGTACGFPQQPQGAPTVDGFVTRVISPTDFSVNGIHIVCGPDTQTGRSDSKSLAAGCPEQTPFIGEAMTIFGTLEDKGTVADAARIQIQVPPDEEIAGSAIVEAVQSAEVRADGYRVLLPASAAITFNPPLRSPADVRPSDRMQYKARLRPDGVLVASSIAFRRANSGAPPQPTSNARSLWKRIERWPDTMMEQHIAAIGEKLIPGYQRALAESDPGKIHFRFEVIDGQRMGSEPVPLPDGLVLLPRLDVQRLQNDSQIAALLADSIACILENQPWRTRIAVNAATAGESIVDASESLISSAKQSGFTGSRDQMRDVLGDEYAQSGRVGLQLMHDAGFDIEQAPVAWWLLANHDKQLTAVTLPYRPATLYQVLGTLWNNPAVIRPDDASSSAAAGPGSAQ